MSPLPLSHFRANKGKTNAHCHSFWASSSFTLPSQRSRFPFRGCIISKTYTPPCGGNAFPKAKTLPKPKRVPEATNTYPRPKHVPWNYPNNEGTIKSMLSSISRFPTQTSTHKALPDGIIITVVEHCDRSRDSAGRWAARACMVEHRSVDGWMFYEY